MGSERGVNGEAYFLVPLENGMPKSFGLNGLQVVRSFSNAGFGRSGLRRSPGKVATFANSLRNHNSWGSPEEVLQ